MTTIPSQSITGIAKMSSTKTPDSHQTKFVEKF